jgi:hypothetical protein
MIRSGLLIAASLAFGLAASAQQSDRARLDPAYQGVWAINGSCDDVTYIVGTTWIERAGEDICYIDKIEPHGKGIRVTGKCWHEFRTGGDTVYDLVRNADGTLTFGNWPNERIKYCGPVPQDLIDAYKDGH